MDRLGGGEKEYKKDEGERESERERESQRERVREREKNLESVVEGRVWPAEMVRRRERR